MPKASKAQREESLTALRALLKPGDTVHCILRHVSRSGMQRRISFLLMTADGARYLDHDIGRILGLRRPDRGDGLVVTGCGMDMGFHVVYSLARALWPEGYTCAGGRCRSCDHSNGDRSRDPHPHHDGGYALSHHWL